MNSNTENYKLAARASLFGIAVNTVLFILKLSAGCVSSSVAMISDAVHSAADIASAVAIYAGIKLSGRRCTESHPYGYGRYENIAALLLSVLLFATAFGIGKSSAESLKNGTSEITGGGFAVSVSLISIAVKEAVFRFTYKKSKALGSEALLAEAWHHRTDSMASMGSLCGVIGSEAGFSAVDPVAGIILSLFIIRTSLSIFRHACIGLTDTSAPSELILQIKESIKEKTGYEVTDITSRRVGASIFLELTVAVDGNVTVKEAHDASAFVSETVYTFPEVKRCFISTAPNTE